MISPSQFIDPVDPQTIFLITHLKDPTELYVAKRLEWSWRADGHWRIYWEHLLLGSSIDWEVVALRRQGNRVFFQALDGSLYEAKPLTYALFMERVAPLLSPAPFLSSEEEVQAFFREYVPPSANQKELKKSLDQAILEMVKNLPPDYHS